MHSKEKGLPGANGAGPDEARLQQQSSLFGADPIAVIRGANAAQLFLDTLRCVLGDGDELHRFLTSLSDDERFGAHRHLQKLIERWQR